MITWTEILLVVILVLGYFLLLVERVTWWRLGIYFFLIFCIAAVELDTLGRASPNWNFFRGITTATIISYSTDERQNIWLWLQPQMQRSPVVVALPYTNECMADLDFAWTLSLKYHTPLQITFVGFLHRLRHWNFKHPKHCFNPPKKNTRQSDPRINGGSLAHGMDGGGQNNDSLGGNDPYFNIKLREIPQRPAKKSD